MLFRSAFGLTLEDGPISYTTLGVVNATSVMGGLNSTLSAPVILTSTPVGVNFKLFYTTSGVPGYYWLTVQGISCGGSCP